MYKCTDCDKLYDAKPEFCSCGGNSFEQAAPTKQVENQEPEKFSVRNIRKNTDPRQIVSLSIFVLCLILAVVPWLIKCNVKSVTPHDNKKPIVQQNMKIPDIDSFWDNTPAAKPITPIKTALPPPVEEPKAMYSFTEQVRAQKPKVKTMPAKSASVQKAEPAKPPAVKPKVDPKAMYNYKKSLNVALASRMNFLGIQGSGKCAVQFSISPSGKLLNRGFVYQSDNPSLNNEVYNMLMRLPNFTPPPQGYNGEKIKMTFEFNNGDYKFSFVD